MSLLGLAGEGDLAEALGGVCVFHMPVVLRHDLIHGARAVLVDAWVRVYEEQRGLWHLLKHVACQQLRAYAVEQSVAKHMAARHEAATRGTGSRHLLTLPVR